MKLPFSIAIVGPTATGKTAAGVFLSSALDGEVVSIDSMQVYRGMAIGTAKPGIDERQAIAHHMFDVVDPGDPFSAAAYRTLADQAVCSILARGKLPVLVGGTGLYLNALTYEMDFAGTGEDANFRGKLELQAQSSEGKRLLHQALEKVDPESALTLHENDSRRVIRALEIYHATGKPKSAHQSTYAEKKRLVDPLVIGLTMPREQLYQRINQRVESMMAAGLLEEVRALYQQGVAIHAQAMQAIGYKELYAVLQGKTTLAEAVALIQQRSRQYAKRQITWFSRDPRVQWIDITSYREPADLHSALLEIANHARGERNV